MIDVPLLARPMVTDGSVSPTGALVDVPRLIPRLSTSNGLRSSSVILLVQETTSRLVVVPINMSKHTT